MLRLVSGLFLAVFALIVVAGDPDAAKSIVVHHCVKCRAAPNYNPEGGPPSVTAPSLMEKASESEPYNEARLRVILRAPH